MSIEAEKVAIVSFEGMVKRAAVDVKRQLAEAESGSEFYLDISCSGRIHDGELKVIFKLSESSYGGLTVKGNRLDSVVEEFVRRKGWDKQHSPLQISQGDQDQIEF